MLKYIGKRILFMIPLLLGITIICFFVMHLAPGSPTDLQTQMNPKASVQMKERLQTLYELDKPIHVQYWSWLKKISHGNLGISFSSDHRPVTAKIMERLPITIIIEFLSLLIIIAIAIPWEYFPLSIRIRSSIRSPEYLSLLVLRFLLFGWRC
jgi:peptide/nickel transport system permease protein